MNITINESQYLEATKILASKIRKDFKPRTIYGIPNGGNHLAIELSQIFKVPIIPARLINKNTLIVDDLIDSGRTSEPYRRKYKFACLYRKPYSPLVKYCVQEIEGWIEFYYERPGADIETNITRIIEYIGDNPTRQGLKDTPRRVAKAYSEIFKGYKKNIEPNITLFNNGADGIVYDEMIIDRGEFYSICEHHLLPFFGTYHFAYVPSKKIIGLSKIARVIDYFSARLQVQERLVKQVVDYLERNLEPAGIGLILKARHLCKEMRGIKKTNSEMVTSELRGVFRNNPQARNEFLNLIK